MLADEGRPPVNDLCDALQGGVHHVLGDEFRPVQQRQTVDEVHAALCAAADDGAEAFCKMLDRVEEILGPERAGTFHSHFSHIQFTPNGGEKCHRTFADDDGYGPDWAPLAAEVARRGWGPTFICESAGTQAEDAAVMKKIYLETLK